MKPEQPPSHDTSYKALFSCPELVRDLLRGYVPGKWLEQADYDSLTRINASYVSRSNKQRHDDMVWRIDIGGHWLWVYLVLEFQSEPDPWMAVRIMQYTSLLAEQLVREGVQEGLSEGRLPPILPIVLYNGKPEWRAPLDVADCFGPPPDGLEAYRPALRYLLLDERRLQQHPQKEMRNFADAVFRMEASQRLQDAIAVIAALKDVLRTPELQTVRRAFSQWIKALLQRRATDSMIEEIDTIKDVFEELEMLTEHRETWFDDALEKGILQGQEKGFLQGQEKGREKGREEGREAALIAVARNMLKRGVSVEEIVQVTGLQAKAVQSLLH
ncbi:MAG: Rpn family recombination-promoting nuclease/putative transposase [Azoarcus sp.]|jgi:predicted transposase/invertase (TIGR01784 family)|nr:Rpn family recombination-promoting nuclease/putative transposase [Azoarcus sp.]